MREFIAKMVVVFLFSAAALAAPMPTLTTHSKAINPVGSAGSHSGRFAGAARMPKTQGAGLIQNFTYTLDVTVEAVDSEPEPDMEILHGPALRSDDRDSDAVFSATCYSELVDQDGGVYGNLAAQHTLLNPAGQVIATGEGHSVSVKSFIVSHLTYTLTNPDEGTYKCRVHYWVDFEYIGYGDYDFQVTWPVPTGEANDQYSPWGTNANDLTRVFWNVMLQPTNIAWGGRLIKEATGLGSGPDTCHYPGAPVPYFDHVTNEGTWIPVAPNSSGKSYVDILGWAPAAVNNYRNANRAPCDANIIQDMSILMRNGETRYITNTLRVGITDTTVWVRRADKEREQVW